VPCRALHQPLPPDPTAMSRPPRLQYRPRPHFCRCPYLVQEHDEKAKPTLLPSPSPSQMPLLYPSLTPPPSCPDEPPHRASTREETPRAHVAVELEPSQAKLSAVGNPQTEPGVIRSSAATPPLRRSAASDPEPIFPHLPELATGVVLLYDLHAKVLDGMRSQAPPASSRPNAPPWTDLPVSFLSFPLPQIASPPRLDPPRPIPPPPRYRPSPELA
jgi:hypothetical protein